MRRPGHILLVLLSSALIGAQAPPADDETTQHLASMRERLEDSSIDPTVRADLALETAATLDRSARAETKLDGKIARWDAAVDLLGSFAEKNPDLPRKREIGLQAAVYRWAQARAWNDQRSLFPTDARSTKRETAALDDAIARLRLIVGGEAGPITDNIKFRLAWALADRAALEPSGAPTAASRRQEALELLAKPPSEPSLSGYQSILKAELLRDVGKLEEAAEQVAAAAKAPSPPPASEILDVLSPILITQRRFADARKAADAMPLPPSTKNLYGVRIDLAELKATEVGDPGRARRQELKEDVLRRIRELREAKAPEVRIALTNLAADSTDFDPDTPAALWDAIAEGFEIRGDPASAARMSVKAAVKADRDGRRAEAAASRLRAGGFLFQAGRYADVDPIMETVVNNSEAGESRPRASLLLALARSRLAAGTADGNSSSYELALRRHLRLFPDDPSATEVRWLLANWEQAQGRFPDALTLWKAIPPESPRWVQACTAACDGYRRTIEDRVANDEREGLETLFAEASSFIAERLQVARRKSESDVVELLLAQARLNLVPFVGRADLCRNAADECLAMNLTVSQRYRARLLRLAALAALGRYVEAERDAHQHAGWASPADRAALQDIVRQIDLAASVAEADLPQRRFGLVVALLLGPVLQDASLTDELRNELTFRMARAQLSQGDARAAQATLRNWSPSIEKADDRFLKDLADAYSRLDAHELAIDVERLRIKKVASGSKAWFDARYGLALAYYRLGRKQDATQLIEATSILHPDLGGGRLREKFIRLRQRLGSAP